MEQLLQPPLDFSPVEHCSWAEWSENPPQFITTSPKRRGRRALGIKYEKAVHAHLSSVYGDCYMPSQWIRFRSDDGTAKIRWCQTDGVIVDRSGHNLTIVEAKYSHTELAWWQLYRLYLPVLARLFDGHGYEIRCVEVCKWFDPSVRCPAKPRLRERIEDVQVGEFAVHIYKP